MGRSGLPPDKRSLLEHHRWIPALVLTTAIRVLPLRPQILYSPNESVLDLPARRLGLPALPALPAHRCLQCLDPCASGLVSCARAVRVRVYPLPLSCL